MGFGTCFKQIKVDFLRVKTLFNILYFSLVWAIEVHMWPAVSFAYRFLGLPDFRYKTILKSNYIKLGGAFKQ